MCNCRSNLTWVFTTVQRVSEESRWVLAVARGEDNLLSRKHERAREQAEKKSETNQDGPVYIVMTMLVRNQQFHLQCHIIHYISSQAKQRRLHQQCTRWIYIQIICSVHGSLKDTNRSSQTGVTITSMRTSKGTDSLGLLCTTFGAFDNARWSVDRAHRATTGWEISVPAAHAAPF